jgi:hypothetical protein
VRALENGQLSNAVAAIKEKIILPGKRIERSEVGGPGEFESLTDDELERALFERVARLGFTHLGEIRQYPSRGRAISKRGLLKTVRGSRLIPGGPEAAAGSLFRLGPGGLPERRRKTHGEARRLPGRNARWTSASNPS